MPHGAYLRYVTFSILAGVDPADDWTDPTTKQVHPVDGISQWPSIVSGATSPRTLPTTHKSLLVDDGKGHMWKLINGNETRADRFHANGSVYEDPFNVCLPGGVNGSYGIQFDCRNSLGENGGGGRMSCIVCSDDNPCLYDVLADEGNRSVHARPRIITILRLWLTTVWPNNASILSFQMMQVRRRILRKRCLRRWQRCEPRWTPSCRTFPAFRRAIWTATTAAST